jgi:hypothetical protein
MSKRNSRAAKAARRAAREAKPATTMPPTTTRAAVADAVHKAVSDLHATYPDYDQAGLGACALYAFAGAVVASVVTGGTYHPQAGKLIVRTGPKDEDGAYDALQMDPAVTGYNGMEFHAWFVRDPGRGPGRQSVAWAELELADLSFRHYPAMARAHGAEWNRGGWPAYFWDRASRVLDLGVTLAADARMQEMVTGDSGTRRIGEAVSRVALDYYAGRVPVLPWRAMDAEDLAAWERGQGR